MSDIPHRIPLAWCTAEWLRLGFASCGNIMVGLDFPAQKYFAIRWQYSKLGTCYYSGFTIWTIVNVLRPISGCKKGHILFSSNPKDLQTPYEREFDVYLFFCISSPVLLFTTTYKVLGFCQILKKQV